MWPGGRCPRRAAGWCRPHGGLCPVLLAAATWLQGQVPWWLGRSWRGGGRRWQGPFPHAPALPASPWPCLACGAAPAPVPAGLSRLVLRPAELLEAGAVLAAEQSWSHFPRGLLVAASCSHVAVLSNASQLRAREAAGASRSMPSSGGWQSCRAGCPWVPRQPAVPVPTAHVSFKKHSVALPASPVKPAPRATAGTVQGEAVGFSPR